MSFADLVFTVGGVILAAGLLPSVFGPEKPALATSLVTGSVVAVYAVTFLHLGLLFSSLTSFVQVALWAVLAVQEFRGRGR